MHVKSIEFDFEGGIFDMLTKSVNFSENSGQGFRTPTYELIDIRALEGKH